MKGGGGAAPTFTDVMQFGDGPAQKRFFTNCAGEIAFCARTSRAPSTLGADVSREQIVHGRARRFGVVQYRCNFACDRNLDAQPLREIARDARRADAFGDVSEPAE